MFNLEGKVAVVTGARRGIGRGIALKLAEAGAKVIVSDIDEADCQKVVEEVGALGSEGLAVRCDVTSPADVKALVERAVEKFGRLDVLVNNAGIAEFKPFLELTEADWDKTLNINLKGYFLCAQAAAREMVKAGRGGKIVNIASVAGFIGFPTVAHYCASKGGVLQLTRTLALELAKDKINVNAVAPGVIDTPMTAGILSDPEQSKQFMAKIPWGRVGQPEDIAAAVVFLASSEADYITGATLVVDGGWLAG